MEQRSREDQVAFADPRTPSTALSFPTRAACVEISDQISLSAADELRKSALAMIAKIRETFDPQIKKADTLHSSLIAERKKFLDPLDRAVSILKKKIADYLYAQDQKRLEAERINALAEKKARQEAEKTIDKAHDLVEAGKPAQADAVIEKGFTKANEILAAAPVIPEKPVVQATFKPIWKFRIVDVNKIPRDYMMPDSTKIGIMVRAFKEEAAAKIPGIEVYPERSIADKSEK